MKFQLERIALFSDAVFAIAITLMMIEIKAPHLGHHVSFGEAFFTFMELMPVFLGTILSFYLIGMFWTKHHKLMKYLTGYTPKLIWLNISFLLCIAFIPFSTSFVFENFQSFSPLPLVVYNLNYVLATVLEYRLFSYAFNPKNGICTGEPIPESDYNKKEMLFPIVVYTLVSVLAFVNPTFAATGYAAFAFENWITKSRKKK
ncbi:MAG: TMEM175 family protein [Bacteroidota bacterium]